MAPTQWENLGAQLSENYRFQFGSGRGDVPDEVEGIPSDGGELALFEAVTSQAKELQGRLDEHEEGLRLLLDASTDFRAMGGTSRREFAADLRREFYRTVQGAWQVLKNLKGAPMATIEAAGYLDQVAVAEHQKQIRSISRRLSAILPSGHAKKS